MRKAKRKREHEVSTTDPRWYRQPIAWLGISIFVVTLAGCIHLILFAVAHEDPSLVFADKEVSFRIPATRKPTQPPATPPPAKP